MAGLWMAGREEGTAALRATGLSIHVGTLAREVHGVRDRARGTTASVVCSPLVPHPDDGDAMEETGKLFSPSLSPPFNNNDHFPSLISLASSCLAPSRARRIPRPEPSFGVSAFV
jgi:hypothetical protein